MSLELTLNRFHILLGVSIGNFEQVNASWEGVNKGKTNCILGFPWWHQKKTGYPRKCSIKVTRRNLQIFGSSPFSLKLIFAVWDFLWRHNRIHYRSLEIGLTEKPDCIISQTDANDWRNNVIKKFKDKDKNIQKLRYLITNVKRKTSMQKLKYM